MEQQIGQWILIGILITITAFDKVRKRFKGNSNKSEVGDNPNPCASHGERLATLEEAVGNIERTLVRLERKINGLNKK